MIPSKIAPLRRVALTLLATVLIAVVPALADTVPANPSGFVIRRGTNTSLWRQLSGRLHDQPVDFVAYEIMNEPVAENPEDWNKLVAAAHATIRRLEPNRVLIIGSNLWQLPHTMPLLKIPAGDRNIILST